MLKSILQGVLLKRYWQNKQKFGPRAFSTSTHPGQDPKTLTSQLCEEFNPPLRNPFKENV